MVRHFGLAVVEAYMRHVQDNAEEAVRRVLDALERRRVRLRDGRRRRDPGRGSRSIAAARRATIDFTGTSAAAPDQFQRARRGLHGGGALCLPHAGRRRHPAERRLPEAARHRHPRRLDAEPALSGGGGGRQCRDLAMHHRRALWRAGRDGGGAGHDEQFHLRQRALPILRDDLRRLGRGAGLRRHRRRAHAHDQHAPHRPRGAGMALPGAAREFRDPPRLGRARPHGMAATAWSAASASARR